MGHLARLIPALVLAALLAPAPAAAKRDADPLSLGPIAPLPTAGPVRDTVLDRGERSRLRARASSDVREYDDGDGHSISVQVSRAYGNRVQMASRLAAFLGGLLHGDEMEQLGAIVATPLEIRHLCGGGALACYSPAGEQMVVSGEDAPPGEPPRELVIAHEYGHHLATNRSNRPWSALDRGTKRWSTHERICRGIERGEIRPSNYFQNPGEAFAEAYAFRHYPDAIGWQWEIARPDAAAFGAIAADVSFPWTRSTSIGWSGELDRRDPREVMRVETPLDGRLKLRLDGPRGADFDLALLAPRRGRVLDRARGPGPDHTVRHTVCGQRAVRVAVVRDRGRGAFEVKAARP
ncbi:MAG TPA: hypothetical protein VK920_07100 [Solirubrobacterales bacterium]|nr:hypothetical protein [Solirubrobacterales bacterium]